MSAFVVKIITDNAAFDEGGDEVAMLLHSVAISVADLPKSTAKGKLTDSNGNSVGHWAWHMDGDGGRDEDVEPWHGRAASDG